MTTGNELPLIPGREVMRLLDLDSTQLFRLSQLVAPSIPARGSGTDSEWTYPDILSARIVLRFRSLGITAKQGCQPRTGTPDGDPFTSWVTNLRQVITHDVAKRVADDGPISLTEHKITFSHDGSVAFGDGVVGDMSKGAVQFYWPNCVADLNERWCQHVRWCDLGASDG